MPFQHHLFIYAKLRHCLQTQLYVYPFFFLLQIFFFNRTSNHIYSTVTYHTVSLCALGHVVFHTSESNSSIACSRKQALSTQLGESHIIQTETQNPSVSRETLQSEQTLPHYSPQIAIHSAEDTSDGDRRHCLSFPPPFKKLQMYMYI